MDAALGIVVFTAMIEGLCLLIHLHTTQVKREDARITARVLAHRPHKHSMC